ncbi:MAG TPA: hypothetical protein VF832_13975 [Longimicrobiales bacterium]
MRVISEGTVATLRELRDARFHAGLCCVQCSSVRVQRWGTFSGRQRYRCRDCRRTFSDLTGTPLAYSKRPELWKPFARCMLESLSVRATARRLAIDKDTAWRWRHALLDHRDGRTTAFHGIVETVERDLPLNRKGQRGLARPRQRAPARHGCGLVDPNRVWIIFASDRGATSDAEVIPGRHPRARDYEALITPSEPIYALLGPFGAFRAAGTFASGAGIRYMRLPGENRWQRPGSLLHLENVLRFERDFRGWLRRFRGVASRYLSNYLGWYRFLESLEGPAARLLFEAVRRGVGTPTVTAPDPGPESARLSRIQHFPGTQHEGGET